MKNNLLISLCLAFALGGIGLTAAAATAVEVANTATKAGKAMAAEKSVAAKAASKGKVVTAVPKHNVAETVNARH